jgi:hypothetical protein
MVNEITRYIFILITSRYDFCHPQIIAQLVEMSKLLASSNMIGVRTPVIPLCL